MSQTSNVKLTFKPRQVTDKLLESLKDRAQEILRRRYGLNGTEKQTLQYIGDHYGITRERVRQIENFAIKAIRMSDSFDEARHIFDELKDVMHDLGGVVEEKELLEALSGDQLDQNHIHLHLVLGDHFTKHKEDKHFKARWSVVDELAKQVSELLKDIHDNLTHDELYEDHETIKKVSSHDVAKDIHDDHLHPHKIKRWLGFSKYLDQNALGQWGHSQSPNVKHRGIRDLAYLVLRNQGGPLHFREVAEEIKKVFNRDVHVATCHNELIKDERFVLVGRGLYALQEWGYRTGTAREIIKQVLEEAGEPLSKEDIMKRVKKERYLKENTIVVNLQNPKYFKKTDNGLYTIA